MTRRIFAAALLGTSLLAGAGSASAEHGTPTAFTIHGPADRKAADRPALKHYDVDKKGLAIDGYDPVAYFPELGGMPTKGSKSTTAAHRGVTYRFASERNKKAFLAGPARFEPAYGGWCARAMADGKGSA